MYPELGQIALILALLLAVLLSVVPLVGSVTGRDQLLAFARPLSAGLFVFAAAALAALALFALYRVVKGLSKPVEEQTDFWPASWVTPVAAEMDPRGPDEPDYDEGAEEYWEDEEETEDEG